MRRPILCAGRPASLILLAGGQSCRMKRNKALLPVPGGTLLGRLLLQVEGYFDDILVSVSPGQLFPHVGHAPTHRRRGCKDDKSKQEAEFPAFRRIEDAVPDQGPMAGILAGLNAAAHDVCVVIACDIPDVRIGFLRRLVRYAEAWDVVVPVTQQGHLEPLFAVYRQKVIPEMKKLLASGRRSLLPLLDAVKTRRVCLDDSGWLKNLNTPEEYRTFVESL